MLWFSPKFSNTFYSLTCFVLFRRYFLMNTSSYQYNTIYRSFAIWLLFSPIKNSFHIPSHEDYFPKLSFRNFIFMLSPLDLVFISGNSVRYEENINFFPPAYHNWPYTIYWKDSLSPLLCCAFLNPSVHTSMVLFLESLFCYIDRFVNLCTINSKS